MIPCALRTAPTLASVRACLLQVLLSRDLTAKLADVGFARAMRATHHSIEGPTGTFDYVSVHGVVHMHACMWDVGDREGKQACLRAWDASQRACPRAALQAARSAGQFGSGWPRISH